MAVKDALKCLNEKPILGEYGACTRPFVILDVDEYRMIVDALKIETKRRRVPRESRRETQTV